MNFGMLMVATVFAACGAYVQYLRRQLDARDKRIYALEQVRANLESVLERRGRRLDVLLSSISEAVLRVDSDGRVLMANTQAQRLFHANAITRLPQPMPVFYRDPGWQKAFRRALRALPRASALPDMRVGEQVLAARLVPLGSHQALLLCVDMTEQARMEKQRRAFLGNLIHDLKTPLTSILGYARSIQTFADKPELQQEAAEVIAREARHVNALLENLLTLENIGHGPDSHEARTSLSEVCRQVCDLLAFQCRSKQVVLQSEVPDSLPDLAISFDELTRIIMNLLVNALNHSPAGGRIRLSGRVDGDACAVTIVDEGPGIPERHLKRVTERFYQVDASRSHGGHGLGLAIVRELMDARGGQLSLQNGPERGLEVRLRLPLADAGTGQSDAVGHAGNG